MQTCSFCGRQARRMLKVHSLSLCESCEASLLRVSAGCAAYDWFVRAVRRALVAQCGGASRREYTND